jgi:hypothetical protein
MISLIRYISRIAVFCTCFFFVGCDAYLGMPYIVKNKTKETVQLKITNYQPSQNDYIFARVVDTIIALHPNESVMVGYNRKLDFPWGTKNSYRNQKGVTNFDLLQNDTIVPLDKSDANWKYIRKTARFTIRKK